jgi:hypothetical protein
MVEDLLRGFLPEARPPGILERRSEIYFSEGLERRELDLVWRIRGRRDKPALYLLLEFQSRVDRQMPLRFSVYSGLVCQDLLKSGEVSRRGKLPPVLAVVLYNGWRRWTEQEGGYQLIDVRRHPLPADEDNLVALLCELERSRTVEALTRTIERLAQCLAPPEMADLRRAFLALLRESLLPGRFPEAKIPAMLDLEEVRPMLRDTVIGWTRQWKQEGKKEGRREGEVRLLVRQLELKFGPLSVGGRERIDAADSDRLLEWGELILTARSLDEVFGD